MEQIMRGQDHLLQEAFGVDVAKARQNESADA
jgi:hypothetical protein